MTSIRSTGALNDGIGDVLVATHAHLDGLPTAPDLQDHHLDRLDLGISSDVSVWLRVFNEAYQRDWGPTECAKWVTANDDLEVLATFVIRDGRGPVGVASVGCFRRAPAVGAGHYLGVIPRARGTGAALALVQHRFAYLRQLGFERAESQTHLWRTPAIKLHFECGFVPKVRLDDWNSPDVAAPEQRVEAQLRLHLLHEEWLASSDTTIL